MARKPSISDPNGEVDRHINTSYDTVKIVSDDIEAVKTVAAYLSGASTENYLGAFAVAPVLDNFGEALSEGDLYYNTVTDLLYGYSGSTWEPIGVPDGVGSTTYIQASAPSSPSVGDGWLSTVNGAETTWDGSVWQPQVVDGLNF